MGEKGNYQPKYSNKCEYYEFSTDYGKHAMMGIPTQVNEVTGMGKVNSYGVGKLKAIADNIVEVKKFVSAHEDEASRQIKEEEHEGKEWDSNG